MAQSLGFGGSLAGFMGYEEAKQGIIENNLKIAAQQREENAAIAAQQRAQQIAAFQQNWEAQNPRQQQAQPQEQIPSGAMDAWQDTQQQQRNSALDAKQNAAARIWASFPMAGTNKSAYGQHVGVDSDTVRRTIASGDNKSMLDLIAKAEGTEGKGRQGYNESFGYGAYTGGKQNLTSMTLDQIDALQTKMLQNPNNDANSSALGRYQITRTTLRDIRRQLGLRGDQKFDAATQDALANYLLAQKDKLNAKQAKEQQLKQAMQQNPQLAQQVKQQMMQQIASNPMVQVDQLFQREAQEANRKLQYAQALQSKGFYAEADAIMKQVEEGATKIDTHFKNQQEIQSKQLEDAEKSQKILSEAASNIKDPSDINQVATAIHAISMELPPNSPILQRLQQLPQEQLVAVIRQIATGSKAAIDKQKDQSTIVNQYANAKSAQLRDQVQQAKLAAGEQQDKDYNTYHDRAVKNGETPKTQTEWIGAINHPARGGKDVAAQQEATTGDLNRSIYAKMNDPKFGVQVGAVNQTERKAVSRAAEAAMSSVQSANRLAMENKNGALQITGSLLAGVKNDTMMKSVERYVNDSASSDQTQVYVKQATALERDIAILKDAYYKTTDASLKQMEQSIFDKAGTSRGSQLESLMNLKQDLQVGIESALAKNSATPEQAKQLRDSWMAIEKIYPFDAEAINGLRTGKFKSFKEMTDDYKKRTGRGGVAGGEVDQQALAKF